MRVNEGGTPKRKRKKIAIPQRGPIFPGARGISPDYKPDPGNSFTDAVSEYVKDAGVAALEAVISNPRGRSSVLRTPIPARARTAGQVVSDFSAANQGLSDYHSKLGQLAAIKAAGATQPEFKDEDFLAADEQGIAAYVASKIEAGQELSADDLRKIPGRFLSPSFRTRYYKMAKENGYDVDEDRSTDYKIMQAAFGRKMSKAEQVLRGLVGDFTAMTVAWPAGVFGGAAAAGRGPEALKDYAKEGFVDPYLELKRHPGEMLTHHPLQSGLLVAAPIGFAGRLGRLRPGEASARPDINLEGTRIPGQKPNVFTGKTDVAVLRRGGKEYSKDFHTEAVQRLYDLALGKSKRLQNKAANKEIQRRVHRTTAQAKADANRLVDPLIRSMIDLSPDERTSLLWGVNQKLTPDEWKSYAQRWIDKARSELEDSGKSDVDVKAWSEVHSMWDRIHKDLTDPVTGRMKAPKNVDDFIQAASAIEGVNQELLKSMGMFKKDRSHILDPSEMDGDVKQSDAWRPLPRKKRTQVANDTIWYHYTDAPGLHSGTIASELTADEGLYGPGFYMANLSDSPYMPEFKRGYGVKIKVKNILDLDQPAEPPFMKAAKDAFENTLQWGILTQRVDPNHAPRLRREYDEMSKAVKDRNMKAGSLHHTIGGIFGDYALETRFARNINEEAAKTYQAYTHHGGRATSQDYRYQVLILLDPLKHRSVKEAVEEPVNESGYPLNAAGVNFPLAYLDPQRRAFAESLLATTKEVGTTPEDVARYVESGNKIYRNRGRGAMGAEDTGMNRNEMLANLNEELRGLDLHLSDKELKTINFESANVIQNIEKLQNKWKDFQFENIDGNGNPYVQSTGLTGVQDAIKSLNSHEQLIRKYQEDLNTLNLNPNPARVDIIYYENQIKMHQNMADDIKRQLGDDKTFHEAFDDIQDLTDLHFFRDDLLDQTKRIIDKQDTGAGIQRLIDTYKRMKDPKQKEVRKSAANERVGRILEDDQIDFMAAIEQMDELEAKVKRLEDLKARHGGMFGDKEGIDLEKEQASYQREIDRTKQDLENARERMLEAEVMSYYRGMPNMHVPHVSQTPSGQARLPRGNTTDPQILISQRGKPREMEILRSGNIDWNPEVAIRAAKAPTLVKGYLDSVRDAIQTKAISPSKDVTIDTRDYYVFKLGEPDVGSLPDVANLASDKAIDVKALENIFFQQFKEFPGMRTKQNITVPGGQKWMVIKREDLSEVAKALNNEKPKLPESTVGRGLYKASDYWRYQALNLRPGYLINNILGNTILALLGGARPQDFIRAKKEVYRDLVPDIIEQSGFNINTTRKLAPDFKEGFFNPITKVGDWVMGKNVAYENFSRRALFLAAARKDVKKSTRRSDIDIEALRAKNDEWARASDDLTQELISIDEGASLDYVFSSAKASKRKKEITDQLAALDRENDRNVKLMKQADEINRMADEAANKLKFGDNTEYIDKVNQFLGDFSKPYNYRMFLVAPFYRWIGHITKLALYTAPVKYPGRALLLENLGQLGMDVLGESGADYRQDLLGALPLNTIDLPGGFGQMFARTQAQNPLATAGALFPPDPKTIIGSQGLVNSTNPILKLLGNALMGEDLSAPAGQRELRNEKGLPAQSLEDRSRVALNDFLNLFPVLNILSSEAGMAPTSLKFIDEQPRYIAPSRTPPPVRENSPLNAMLRLFGITIDPIATQSESFRDQMGSTQNAMWQEYLKRWTRENQRG